MTPTITTAYSAARGSTQTGSFVAEVSWKLMSRKRRVPARYTATRCSAASASISNISGSDT